MLLGISVNRVIDVDIDVEVNMNNGLNYLCLLTLLANINAQLQNYEVAGNNTL